MKERQLMRRIIVAIVGAIAVVFAMAIFIIAIRQNHSDYDTYRYDEHWNITIGELTYQDVSLTKFTVDKLPKGTVVTLRNKIPEELNGGCTLRMLIYLSTVEAKIDGKEVYSYGKDLLAQNKLVGSGYHFIPLSPGDAGKTLEIRVEMGEDIAFTSIPCIEGVDSKAVYANFADRHIISIFISIFLFMFGGVGLLLSVIALNFNKAYYRLFLITSFSFLMGVWSMCNSKVLQIFSTNLSTNSFLEYISLYVATIPFVLLIGHIRSDLVLWKKRIMHGIYILLIAFAIISLILQLTNVMHFPKTVSVFHMICVISLSAIAVMGTRKFSEMDNVERYLTLGIFVMCVFIAMDLARFNIQKYMFPENEVMATSIVPIGSLFFVILLLISYLQYLYDMVMTKAEKEVLVQMAYHDSLSGLYNRTKCAEEFERLDGVGNYAIISLDLNGLKTINDKLGHAMGDQLLQNFGEILCQAFQEVGDVYRMGGDEFVVIVEGEKRKSIPDTLRYMIELEKKKSEELPFLIHSSFGVAYCEECKNEGSEKVYQLADQRMYVMKERHYATTKQAKRT